MPNSPQRSWKRSSSTGTRWAAGSTGPGSAAIAGMVADLPERPHRILADRVVGRHQREAPHERLRDEHPVERIAMEGGELRQMESGIPIDVGTPDPVGRPVRRG